MSIFNEANELASELVYGKGYQSDEPVERPKRVTLFGGDDEFVVFTATEESHDEWKRVASKIHRLLSAGYCICVEGVEPTEEQKQMERIYAAIREMPCLGKPVDPERRNKVSEEINSMGVPQFLFLNQFGEHCIWARDSEVVAKYGSTVLTTDANGGQLQARDEQFLIDELAAGRLSWGTKPEPRLADEHDL